MSGFEFAYRRGSVLPVPNAIEVLIGKSTQIHAGDVLILTTNSTYTGTGANQYPVVRPLWSGDTVTSSNGVVGVAPFDIQTNASGQLTTVTSTVTVDGRGKLNVDQQYTNIFPTDPVTGYLRITIWAFDAENVFRGKTDTNDIANFYTVGRVAGVTASAASAPSNYTVNIGAATANSPLYIDGVDTEDPQFNSSNGGGDVFFHCLSTFYQNANGNLWST